MRIPLHFERCGPFILALIIVALVTNGSLALTCVGDCDGDGSVKVDELIAGVSIALDLRPLDRCPPFDSSRSDAIEINELIAAVDSALNGCQAPPSATPTVTPAVPTASPTASITPTDTAVPTDSATATPSETPTQPVPPICTAAVVADSPKPSSACAAIPGMFVDCFDTSGIDTGALDEGENGAAVADIDGDGFPDVFFWNIAGGSRLFRNLGHDMQFERVADSPLVWAGLTTVVAAAFGDLDNDGKPDLVVAVDKTAAGYRCPGFDDPVQAFHVFHNLGAGRFEETTDAWGFDPVFPEPSGKPSRVGFSLVDLNLDGRLDIVEFGRGPTIRPLAFLSQPDGTTWKEAGRDIFGDGTGFTFTVLFSDWNHDQLLDAFIINDYGNELPARYYQRVDRSLSFEDRDLLPVFGKEPYGSPMGGVTADLNGDGELDLVVSDTGEQHLFSLGIDVADAWGVEQNPSRFGKPQNCWSVAVLDLENDGTPDLFFDCAGFRIGWPDEAATFLLRNRGGVFEVAGGLLPNEAGPTWDEGLAVADFDQDGRLDLFTGGEEHPPRLLWNRIPGGGALAIRLRGKRVNAEGIGARIEVEADGLPIQVREMFPGGTTWGYGDTQLLFGMGQATHAKVTVDWRPAGGTAVQTVEVAPGARVIEEP